MRTRKTPRPADAKPTLDFMSTVLLACPDIAAQLDEVMRKIQKERHARKEQWIEQTAADIVRDNPTINGKVAKYAARHSNSKTKAYEKSRKIMEMFDDINSLR